MPVLGFLLIMLVLSLAGLIIYNLYEGVNRDNPLIILTYIFNIIIVTAMTVHFHIKILPIIFIITGIVYMIGRWSIRLKLAYKKAVITLAKRSKLEPDIDIILDKEINIYLRLHPSQSDAEILESSYPKISSNIETFIHYTFLWNLFLIKDLFIIPTKLIINGISFFLQKITKISYR